MKTETLKYRVLTFIRYFGDAFYYPFFALYLVQTGLAEARIGFLISISPLLALFLNPIYLKICKTLKITKNTLAIISILEGIMIGLVGFVSNYPLIIAITVLIAIFGSCHYGLMDSVLAVYAEKENINYSSLRIFGSAAYIIGTTLAGVAAKNFSYSITFIICAVFFVLSGVMYYLLKPISSEVKVTDESQNKNIIQLLKNPTFVFFCIFYGISMATQFSCNNFLGTYLETRGIDSSQYGLIYSYFVIFEVVTLILLNKFEKKWKLTDEKLLLIASFATFIRIFACFIDIPLIVLVILLAFRGIGYACMLHSAWRYIVKLVKEENGAQGIMVCTCIYSIFYFLVNNLGGRLIEYVSYDAYHLVASLLIFITTIMAAMLYKAKEK